MKSTSLPIAFLTLTLAAIAGLPPEQQPKPDPQAPLAPVVPPELLRMHADHLHHFATSPGFGMSRVIRMPTQATVTLAGVTYRAPRPDLIALETKAVAYQSPSWEGLSMANLTNKAARARLQTRPLTKDEFSAVLELREGKDLVQQERTLKLGRLPETAELVRASELEVASGSPVPADAAGKEIPVLRVVGAMRATASCAKCHEVPVGTLLGAFSYTLTPASDARVAPTYFSVPTALPIKR
ncbi:MAG: hypothetical protein ACKODH_04590 [Limisphaerales bacterium]